MSIKYKYSQNDNNHNPQTQGNRKIYPKEIESVVDENDLDEDEISEVEWGWSNEQKKRG